MNRIKRRSNRVEKNEFRVLLVGAFERENFGDLLFLLKTREYLRHKDVTVASPFARGITEYLNEPVYRYVPAINTGSFGGLWVVGGEVGGTSLLDAFRMSFDHPELSGAHADQLARQAAELDEFCSPYLPRISAFTRSLSTTVVINSVGLGGIDGLTGTRRQEALGAVRDASYVSVRDSRSSDVLRRLSVPHNLAPDLVHTIALHGGLQAHYEHDLALVQVRQKTLTEFGTDQFAALLAASKTLAPYRIRLFVAGSAPGHDARELYQAVAAAFRLRAPNRQIDISTTVQPLDKVREISTCGLWIGTSLHGFIVATAFNKPRVGLEGRKLRTYAQTWHDDMPSGVQIADLEGATEAAMLELPSSIRSGRALELAHLADASAHGALAVLEMSFDVHERRRQRKTTASTIRRYRRKLLRRAVARRGVGLFKRDRVV